MTLDHSTLVRAVALTAAIILVALWLRPLLRAQHCASCWRTYAVWPVRGRLNRWMLVCRSCYKTRRALDARRAR